MTSDNFNSLDDLNPMLGMQELMPILRKFKKNANGISASKLGEAQEKVKVAVLSSFSMQHFNEILRLYLAGNKIDCEVYDAGFDNVNFELMDKKSGLCKFKPDYLVFITHYKDIKIYPDIDGDSNNFDECLRLHAKRLEMLWDNAKSLGVSKIFQTNYVIPIARQLGNFEVKVKTSRSAFINSVNNWMSAHCGGGVGLLDFEYIASYVGKQAWFGEKDYFLSKQGISFDVMGLASHLIARAISENLRGPNKCLVVDLDNTLWGGVIGDDGMNGILLGPDNAVGEAYVEFQEYLKLLKSRGVLLAVCSKNDKAMAEKVFKEHPYMVLRLEDIASFVANWDNKAANILRIAEDLNIGLDSLVFFDDNPAERQLVKQFCPSVKVVDVPEDPALFIRSLELGMFFDWSSLTAEDLKRAESYLMEQERKKLADSSNSYGEYLASLCMNISVELARNEDLARVCQLINKTNQFNVRGSRLTRDQIDNYVESSGYKVIAVKLNDKFTNYGLISCIVLKKCDDICYIDTWVMSCRVFNRGVEKEVMNELISQAAEWKCDKLAGEYRPTKKNGYAKDVFLDNGFSRVCGEDEIAGYEMRVSSFKKFPTIFNS